MKTTQQTLEGRTFLIPVLTGWTLTQVDNEFPNTPCYYQHTESGGKPFTLQLLLNTCNGWECVKNLQEQEWCFYIMRNHHNLSLNPPFQSYEEDFLTNGHGYEMGKCCYGVNELETTNWEETLLKEREFHNTRMETLSKKLVLV